LPESGVFCWGANEHGQLGIGTTDDAKSAQKVATDENGLPFGDVNELALAPWHSCARKGDQLYCWGQRYSSAQAEAPLPNGPDRLAPRVIGNLAIHHVAAGGTHTCAIESTGRHVCFGHGTCGELGSFTGDTTCSAPIFYAYQGEPSHACAESLVPIEPPLPGLSAIAAGEIHSCALALGRVFCWGANQELELGRVAFSQDVNAGPVQTDGGAPIDNATALAAGGKHTCAIANGAVICWGDNLAPRMVAGIASPTAIGVAEGNACALQADKTVVCWDDTLVPKAVAGLTNVIAIAPGMNHSCAQKADNTVWCWGKNNRGQLGDGTGVDSASPVKVSGLP
jgi:alpha-tubulin suppressor-like RCC1 family protein